MRKKSEDLVIFAGSRLNRSGLLTTFYLTSPTAGLLLSGLGLLIPLSLSFQQGVIFVYKLETRSLSILHVYVVIYIADLRSSE